MAKDASNSLPILSSTVVAPAKRVIEKASSAILLASSTASFSDAQANSGTELETVTAEAEGVEQPRRRGAWADYRQHIGQVALDTGPYANDVRGRSMERLR